MKKSYIILLLCAAFMQADAQWSHNTSVNTSVANANASDIQTANTNDGRTWIAFYSARGSNYDMRAQLLDVNGNRLLGDSGLLVSNIKSGSATFVFNVCVDQGNNLVIAFQVAKASAYECVMQKVSPAGQLLWGSGVDLGPGLSPYPATLTTNEIAVAWNSNNGKINYQKITASGGSAWTPYKVFGGNSTHTVSRAQILAGTNGKFNMVYQDQFSFPFYTNLYEQRFDLSGNALWASATKITTLTTVSYRYYDVHIENDTTYVGYYGNPSGSNRFDAYIQKISEDGSLLFGTDGIAFSDYSGINDPNEQTIYIAKEKGGNDVWAVCTVTNPSQTTSTVYAQKINAITGARYLGNNAKKLYNLSTKLVSLAFSQLSLCGDEPIFIVTDTDNKLAAVKLNNAGDLAWTKYIRPVGSSANIKFRYGFTDVYKGQAVAVWQEDKGSGDMPYAQNIHCNGNTGFAAPGLIADNVQPTERTLSIKTVYPNPAKDFITANIVSGINTSVHVYITDISGNTMKQFQQTVYKGNNLIQLNISDIKAGSYFIKLGNENGNVSALINKQ